jgi:Fe-S oxidoreductase
MEQKRIKFGHSEDSFVYHDPCELGRGCNIYKEPRNVLSAIGELKKAQKEKIESICCGGSLGSLTLNYDDRVKITQESLKALTYENPDKVVTACPLCLKSFSDQSSVPVIDIAQVVADNLK